MTISIGEVLGGRYRIEALLGEGGMGAVYRAYDTTLERQAAVKVMQVERRSCEKALERFRREAVLNAKVRHPNIVEIYGVDIHNQHPWIAMEYLRGQSLYERVVRQLLRPEEAAWIGHEVLGALALVHAHGMVHRDLKPGNLFLEELPGDAGLRVKLLDFGLVKLRGAGMPRLTAQGMVPGTPQYFAPEQIYDQELDGRCDLFALGLLLYRSLSGHFPYGPGVELGEHMRRLCSGAPQMPLTEAAPRVPQALAEVIHRAIRPPIEERYATAEEMREALLRTGLVTAAPRRLSAAPPTSPTPPATVSPGNDADMEVPPTIERNAAPEIGTLSDPFGDEHPTIVQDED